MNRRENSERGIRGYPPSREISEHPADTLAVIRRNYGWQVDHILSLVIEREQGEDFVPRISRVEI